MIIYPCLFFFFKYMVKNLIANNFFFTHDDCKWFVLFIWIFFFVFVPFLTTNMSIKRIEWLIYPRCRDFTQSSDVMLVLCHFFFFKEYIFLKKISSRFFWLVTRSSCVNSLSLSYHQICDMLLFNLSPIYWLSRVRYWIIYFLIFLGDVHVTWINLIWW